MVRFHFIPSPKPWYWVFTFWRKKWINYGCYRPVHPGEPGYDEAPYEMGFMFGDSKP
jgi:hypothetical protein